MSDGRLAYRSSKPVTAKKKKDRGAEASAVLFSAKNCLKGWKIHVSGTRNPVRLSGVHINGSARYLVSGRHVMKRRPSER
jgi:hypothetical protein